MSQGLTENEDNYPLTVVGKKIRYVALLEEKFFSVLLKDIQNRKKFSQGKSNSLNFLYL